MFAFFDATATGYNATVWKQECDASPVCTRSVWFGYTCGTFAAGFSMYILFNGIITTVRKKNKVQVASGRESRRTNKGNVAVSHRGKRYNYKLHAMISVLVYDVTQVLLLFLGQYGQNLATNRHSQLYAYGFVAVGSFTHTSLVAAHFKTRPLKIALKAIKENEMVDKAKVNADSAIAAESRRYLLSQFSLPTLFHLFWFLWVLPNSDLNPINFARTIQFTAGAAQIVMTLIQFVSFFKLYVMLKKMPSFQDEQRIQNNKSRKRLKKRIMSVVPIFAINFSVLFVMLPVLGTMGGWVAVTLFILVLDVTARFLMFRLMMRRRNAADQSSRTNMTSS